MNINATFFAKLKDEKKLVKDDTIWDDEDTCFDQFFCVFQSLTVYFIVYSRPKNDEKFSLPYVTLVRFHSFVVQGHAKPNIRKSPKI